MDIRDQVEPSAERRQRSVGSGLAMAFQKAGYLTPVERLEKLMVEAIGETEKRMAVAIGQHSSSAVHDQMSRPRSVARMAG